MNRHLANVIKKYVSYHNTAKISNDSRKILGIPKPFQLPKLTRTPIKTTFTERAVTLVF